MIESAHAYSVAFGSKNEPATRTSKQPDLMESLQNRFLVSMPQLLSEEFFRSVILMCHHDDGGAIGIVVNKVTSHCIGEIFSEMDIVTTIDTYARQPVLNGGPLSQELGLVIHNDRESRWKSSLKVDHGLCLTSSKEILADMAVGSGPECALVTFGYASWAPGQLESEIRENSWLTTPVDHEILFSIPFQDRWHRSAAILGIDINQISGQFGHA